jgi:hypothetical protein
MLTSDGFHGCPLIIVEALLGAAGPRPLAPDDSARRIEVVVRLEWQDTVQKRPGRRRATWIAVSGITSAAVIALVLHAHVGQVAPHATVSPLLQRPVYASRVAAPRGDGSYFRVDNEDRPPDRGLPRRVLASYIQETR